MTVPLPPPGDTDWNDWAQMVDDHVKAPDTALQEVDYTNVPAGSVFVVPKNANGTWPARPSNRGDIIFDFDGPDPAPSIVSPPATNGAYARNLAGGIYGDRNSVR